MAIANIADDVRPMFAAITGGDHRRAAAMLRELASEHAALFHRDWLAATIEALHHNRYDALSRPFETGQFVGPAGHVLLVGPYTQRRGESNVTELSALLGQVIEHRATPDVVAALEAVQRAPLHQPVGAIVPIRGLAGCGTLGGEAGEAFVVPDAWGWPRASRGPAINDMAEQLRRFELVGRRCIERIFDADTAAFLLAPMDPEHGGEEVRHRSYELHDAGHASGLGLTRKVAHNLIPGFWYRAVEEWRADGMAFEVGARLLSERDAAFDLASNFCVRFGIDAHRPGGIDQDQDVACIALMLEGLLCGGALRISGGRLSLRELSHRALIEAFEVERHDTIVLTRQELAASHGTAVQRLYAQVEVHDSTLAILESQVRAPCRGLFAVLR